jgi:hypothetical protein
MSVNTSLSTVKLSRYIYGQPGFVGKSMQWQACQKYVYKTGLVKTEGYALFDLFEVALTGDAGGRAV